METEKPIKELTEKERIFCEQYVIYRNGTKAAIIAGYSEDSAREIASQNLTKLHIKEHIEKLKLNIEELCGISKQRVINEHIKIAFSSIAHLHNSWITLKEFDELTNEQKECIAEIVSQKRTVKENEQLVEVDFVKIKLYDKQKSLDAISKMIGYDAVIKTESNIKISSTPLTEDERAMFRDSL